jgi:hypothetical protein
MGVERRIGGNERPSQADERQAIDPLVRPAVEKVVGGPAPSTLAKNHARPEPPTRMSAALSSNTVVVAGSAVTRK